MYPMRNRAGQAMILLVAFVGLAMSIITAAVAVNILGGQNARGTEASTEALTIARSGVENAMIQLIRDPNYAGETLSVGGGTATVTVTGTTQKTIRSVGTVPDHSRTIEVVASSSGGIVSVVSWSEQ